MEIGFPSCAEADALPPIFFNKNPIYEMATEIKLSSKERKRLEKRTIVFNRCKGKCAYCGQPIYFEGLNSFQTDHVKPKKRYKIYGGDCYSPRWEYGADSGSDELENLLPCCQSCNACKSDLSLEGFRERISDRIIRLNKYSSEYQIAKRFGLIEEADKPVVFYFETLKNG